MATAEKIAKIAEATVSTVGGHLLKEAAKNQLDEAVAGVIGKVAETAIGSMAGPLLKVLLKVSDQTSKKLDKIIQEPCITGLREAAAALSVQCATPADEALRDSRLQNADNNLARAFTLVPKGKTQWRQQFYISLTRGLITEHLKANAFTKQHYQYCTQVLSPRRTELQNQRDDLNKTLEAMRRNNSAYMYPSSISYETTVRSAAQIEKELREIAELTTFCESRLE